MTVPTDNTNTAVPADAYLAKEDEGYHKGLGNRQIQMIGIGGAIGTGLFMGAGLKLHSAGPGLFLAYGLCGLFVFFILRALGELVLHRPSSGSFVSYSREFLGEKAAYAVGWMVFLNWAMTSIADTSAIAGYIGRWVKTDVVPGWVWALLALVIVLSVNMISVKWFGEMEFWAALVKVIALVTFLVVGVVVLVWGLHLTAYTPPGEPAAAVAEWHTGVAMVANTPGGWFPHGYFSLFVVLSSVVFAYSAVELVGTAAGEAKDPEHVMPKAINAVLFRIVFFYMGSVALLALLVPYLNYGSGSPFVTFFSSLGAPWAGDVMNAVVITSAMSSLNAGLYSTGRIIRSMAMNGSAPERLSKMNSSGVPYPGILLTCFFTVVGVLLNYLLQDAKEVFSIAIEMASIGVMGGWASIVVCQLQFFKLAKQGLAVRPSFRMPWAPYSNYATLVFLAAVVVIMGLPKSGETDFIKKYEGTITVGAFFFVFVPILVAGWFLLRDRVHAIAQERMGYTGKFPVVANLPLDPQNLPFKDPQA
ncbi:amino acid permease-associated region [Segniliparus rotundus DSM 44985]|uniref:Amino acid permease-associated region n=1 Tax=Segniliparus rotundus (strain ATCC BAA-972 / CDC 1076 / CIP 108378 / DSM 44985 / JCM 13578) TaxID=640132 RepID=D6Z8V9_SEGRD|nr:amino acid permease-associated region [Segniliparus rotundus DSM 44985]